MRGRTWLGASLAVAVAGSAAADPLPITVLPVPLDSGAPAVTAAGQLRYRGGLQLTSPDPRFGGLSGLSVSADGKRLVAVSDTGYWVSARVRYDRDGNLSGLFGAEIRSIRDRNGHHSGVKPDADAEGLAALGDRFVVAFEIHHRLASYKTLGGRAISVFIPPAPKSGRPPALTGNGGLEALTALAGGALLALGEGRKGDGLSPGWIVDGRRWRRLSYRHEPGYRVTGADTLASGDALVLERRFGWIDGFAARIVRVAADRIHPGAVLEGVALAHLAPPLATDNFEAIATRPGEGGGTLIYLISDDNYNIVQHTLLLMFELDDDGAP